MQELYQQIFQAKKNNQLHDYQKKLFPTLADIIYSCIILGSNKHQVLMADTADYNLTMDIKSGGLLNFKDIHDIANQGYRYAIEKFSTDKITL